MWPRNSHCGNPHSASKPYQLSLRTIQINKSEGKLYSQVESRNSGPCKTLACESNNCSRTAHIRRKISTQKEVESAEPQTLLARKRFPGHRATKTMVDIVRKRTMWQFTCCPHLGISGDPETRYMRCVEVGTACKMEGVTAVLQNRRLKGLMARTTHFLALSSSRSTATPSSSIRQHDSHLLFKKATHLLPVRLPRLVSTVSLYCTGLLNMLLRHFVPTPEDKAQTKFKGLLVFLCLVIFLAINILQYTVPYFRIHSTAVLITLRNKQASALPRTHYCLA